MKYASRGLVAAAIVGIAIAGATAARAQSNSPPNSYLVTPLVTDLPGQVPPVRDANLKNAWGVTFSGTASPFWITDNATGLATLYDGDGTIVNVVVKIPCPPIAGQGSSCPTTAAPTGTVWNPSATATVFPVPGATPPTASHFIFATEDGTISAWASGPAATIAVNNSILPNPTNGAVYKGLALGVNVNGVFLYATNFRAGTIDVFDTGFNQVTVPTPGKIDGTFTDPNIPAGFAPFGIQNINGNLFVTYALQNGQKHDDVAGLGNGFVDIFDTDGNLLLRFASGGNLNSPWGVARASAAFGPFNGKILVGNFGDGRINVFDFDLFTPLGQPVNLFNVSSANGNFLDHLRDRNGVPIVIDGLWTLTLGGGAKSSSDTLYFTAGPNGETDGLFGTISPLPQGTPCRPAGFAQVCAD